MGFRSAITVANPRGTRKAADLEGEPREPKPVRILVTDHRGDDDPGDHDQHRVMPGAGAPARVWRPGRHETAGARPWELSALSTFVVEPVPQRRRTPYHVFRRIGPVRPARDRIGSTHAGEVVRFRHHPSIVTWFSRGANTCPRVSAQFSRKGRCDRVKEALEAAVEDDDSRGRLPRLTGSGRRCQNRASIEGWLGFRRRQSGWSKRHRRPNARLAPGRRKAWRG